MPQIPLWCLLAVCCLSVCDHRCAAQDATPFADTDAIRIRVSVCSIRGEVTVPDDLADAGPLIEQLRKEGKIGWLDTTRCSILDGTSAKVAIGARRSVSTGGAAVLPMRSTRSGGSVPEQRRGAGGSAAEIPAAAIDRAFQRLDADGNGELSKAEMQFARQRSGLDLSNQSEPVTKAQFSELYRQRLSTRTAQQPNPFGGNRGTTSFESVLTGSSLTLTPQREADGSVSVKIVFDSNQLEGRSASTAVAEEGESAETPADNGSPSSLAESPSDMTTARTDSVVKLIPGKVRVIRTSLSDQEHSGRSILVFVSLGSTK